MPARRETPGASASVLARLHPLPSPRGVALEILRRSLRDDASVAELARLAQVDPALCGRLLKAANSAAQGARPVATAQEAILRLGLRASARLALAFSLVGDHHGGPCRAFRYGAFWTASLVRGLAAQALAARCEVPGADEAFCAGLLAHVGRLAFATALPGPYSRLLEECAESDTLELRRREQAAFGIDHLALADALLEDWGFPGALRLAVAAHADPDSAREQGGARVARLARVLHAADRVSVAAVAQATARQAPSAEAVRAAHELELAPDELAALLADVERGAAEWASLLGVDPPVGGLLDLEPPASGDAGLPALPGAGERVLVVDADAARGASIAGTLAKNGYRATIARSSDEALTAFVVRRPQALVVDCSTPGVHLGTLCRALRDTQSGETLYVVAVGDVATDHAREVALAEGADDLLARPVSERALLAHLGAGLRARRRCAFLERELAEVRALAASLATDNRLLEGTSRIDRATGLPDRRLALERLAQACAAAARRHAPIACLLVEPDGPMAGEGEGGMPGIAARLKAIVRTADTLCRFGDGEFLVVAPDTDRGEALAFAARLRAAVAGPGGPTASVGIACAAFGDCAPAELVRRAEQALLASRLAGGDRASEYGARMRRVV